jgi:hypothetical protein
MLRDIVVARLRHGMHAGPATAMLSDHDVVRVAAEQLRLSRRAA